MYYSKINKSPVEYLRDWGIDFKHSGHELTLKCIFSDCDSYKQSSRHLYMNENTGLYKCFKCGAKGNLITMAKYLGKDLKTTFRGPKRERTSKKKEKIMYVEYY